MLFFKREPECAARILEEQQGVLFKGKHPSEVDLEEVLTSETLNNLNYLNNFIKEVLRMCAPAVRSAGYKTSAEV